ncbi:hypothetical protein TIFTF001_005363 [Ficus carica]|uniref:Uncharacterized protein n=1 Tax=Ficus carica TaxID=3494 RepID=A0AA88A1G0_FICCA|nr:hypothetical protein TIFTF001_005363 [Ficus carica]
MHSVLISCKCSIGEVAEEVWHEIRRRRAGEVAEEEKEMLDNFLEDNGDRRRVRPEKEENGEEREGLSARIEQWEEIAAIFASGRNTYTGCKKSCFGFSRLARLIY